MRSDEKIVYLNQQDRRAARSGRGVPGVMESLKDLAVGRLCQALGGMLDKVDDALFELAEKAESNNAQTLYFDAMRVVRLQRPEVEKAFRAALLRSYEALIGRGGAASASQTSADDFALVDPHVLEEELALTGMINKARQRYDLALAHLEARLDWVLKEPKVDAEKNPFDPKTICDAFAQASQCLDVDIKARLIILKLFDKHVMSALQGIYDEINKFMSDAGVLPGLKASVRVARGAAPNAADPTVTEAASSPNTGRASPEPGAYRVSPAAESTRREGMDATIDGEVLSLLQSLLAERRQFVVPRGNVEPGAYYVPSPGDLSGYAAALGTEELLRTLSHIQHAPVIPVASHTTGTNFKSLLLDELRAGQDAEKAPKLRPVDDDIIDVVSMLFDFILDDPNLPQGIKALIGRLQIPVLKIALIDKTFFSKKRHPARLLLNELAQAGLGWSETEHGRQDPLYRNIEAAVSRILDEFEDNADVFESVLHQFQQTLDVERKRAQVIEARTRQAAEGKAKVDAARQMVAHEIQLRMGGRPVPAAVERLLLDGWSKVLFIVCLKEGEQSDPWHNGLRVVDELLWSVEPKADPAERKKLISKIPGLLQELREGLNSILFNPVELDTLFRELEVCHVACLNPPTEAESPVAPSPSQVSDADVEQVGAALDAVWNAHQPSVKPASPIPTFTSDMLRKPAPKAEVVTPAADPAHDEEIAPYLAQLKKAKIDTWFEFVQGTDRVRAKLAARLAQGTRFVFVNRSGFKVAEKTVEELAADMRDGIALMLDDAALFDKALEAVIGNLRAIHQQHKSSPDSD